MVLLAFKHSVSTKAGATAPFEHDERSDVEGRVEMAVIMSRGWHQNGWRDGLLRSKRAINPVPP